jgi:hypothetical protein
VVQPVSPYPPPPAKTNAWAILSLVFGVVGIVALPISLICGIVGLNKAKQGRGGRGLAIGGLILSGAWVLVAAGVSVYLLINEDDLFKPVRKTESSADGRSVASYFKTGDCFKALPATGEDVTVVPCSEPHAAEVVAVLMLPEGDFPGTAAVDEYKGKCRQELLDYAPDAVHDRSIGLLKRFPDEKSWELGDRSVTCIATLNPPRTGSLKG